MEIRRFVPQDAETCFRIRSSAFVRAFFDELGARAVSAGVNAFMPSDYIRMAGETEFFIVTRGNCTLGFFTIRRHNAAVAEIPLIYVDLDALRQGTGRACIRFIEEWIAENWREVSTLFVDTVIPKYNGGFYRKTGFKPTEETTCSFPGFQLRAVRFSKTLKREPR